MSQTAYTYLSSDGMGPYESPLFDTKHDAELYAEESRHEPLDWHDYDDNGQPLVPNERIELPDTLVQPATETTAPTVDGPTDAPSVDEPQGVNAGEGTPPTA